MATNKCNDGRRNNRPPKHTQFKPGQSGNPKGRPLGRNSIELSRLSEEAFFQVILDVMQEPVGLTEHGETISVPYIVALFKMMARESLNGDRYARKDLIRLAEKSTKGTDKLFHGVQMAIMDHQDRLLQASSDPGSYEHYHAKRAWFMVRKNLRQVEGMKAWPYENDEPITNEDWVYFLKQCNYLKNKPHEKLPWPPKYPSTVEEEKFENMSERELIQHLYDTFKHRREMRMKEGVHKWPYMVEEPVNDDEWLIFERHIHDRLEGKKNPTKWPPEGWGVNEDSDE